MTAIHGQDEIKPPQVPHDAVGVVLFGGSFDPPHAWHTKIAEAARDAVFGPDGWILFVPTAQSPLKTLGPVASSSDRAAMIGLAAANITNSAVWLDEIDRADSSGHPSYTIETVERLHRVRPGLALRLLIGMDQAQQFHRWHRYRELLKLAEPVVVYRGHMHQRERVRAALAATGAWTSAELKSWENRVVPCEVSAVSSTWVRQAVADPRSDQETVRNLVSSSVLAYIRKNGLYGACATQS